MSAHRPSLRRGSRSLAVVGGAVALALGVAACGQSAQEQVTVGLIVKQETNPFFRKIRDVAQEAARETDAQLLFAAGKTDVDNASQVAALQDMTRRGAKGILIVPADSSGIVPAIEKAREAGVTVVALDTPTDPRSAVDALFATNNMRAGELIGRYAKAKAQEEGIQPKIAMLDLAPGITVGQLRHDGFLRGFGIKDGDPQIVGTANTEGNEAKARAGMERLLRQNPDINVVYSINEPSALGAFAALEAAGKGEDDVILVSVDGGCTAIKEAVRTGEIDATSQQYPENMALEGMDAVVAAARGGEKPSGYRDTGVELITADPVDGVDSRDEGFGVRNCW
jgi:fructose transport system substrate-binding protein